MDNNVLLEILEELKKFNKNVDSLKEKNIEDTENKKETSKNTKKETSKNTKKETSKNTKKETSKNTKKEIPKNTKKNIDEHKMTIKEYVRKQLNEDNTTDDNSSIDYNSDASSIDYNSDAGSTDDIRKKILKLNRIQEEEKKEIENVKKKKEIKKNKLEKEITDEIEKEIEDVKARRGRPRKDEEEKLNCLKVYKKKYYMENIKPFLPASQRGRPKLIKTYEQVQSDIINKQMLARTLAQRKREQIKENKLKLLQKQNNEIKDD